MNENLVFEIEVEKDGAIELPQEALDRLGIGVGAILDLMLVGSDTLIINKNKS